jgi:hypothetical protein
MKAVGGIIQSTEDDSNGQVGSSPGRATTVRAMTAHFTVVSLSQYCLSYPVTGRCHPLSQLKHPRTTPHMPLGHRKP